VTWLPTYLQVLASVTLPVLLRQVPCDYCSDPGTCTVSTLGHRHIDGLLPIQLPSPQVMVTTAPTRFVQTFSPMADVNQVFKQTKQWKTCEVCNELFPSDVYHVYM
jgi:hypothetical protein